MRTAWFQNKKTKVEELLIKKALKHGSSCRCGLTSGLPMSHPPSPQKNRFFKLNLLFKNTDFKSFVNLKRMFQSFSEEQDHGSTK